MLKKLILLLLTAVLLIGVAPLAFADGDGELLPDEGSLEPPPLENIPEPAPAPLPEPTPEPLPEPTPEPQPELLPAPTPEPLPVPTEEPQPEPLPDPSPEPETPAEPVSVISYGAVSGYDLTDIQLRPGVSCTLAGACRLLTQDVMEAAERIFSVVPPEGHMLSYEGAGRDIYPELVTYATAIFLARNYDHIIDDPASLTLTADEMTQLRRVFWEVLRLGAVMRDTEITDSALGTVRHEYMTQVNLESVPASEFKVPLSDAERSRVDVYLAEPIRSALKYALRGNGQRYSAEDPDLLRRDVVDFASSLTGVVPYYWGGKSNTLGWDARWGAPSLHPDGVIIPFGLDCSGMIAWAFINSAGTTNALALIGDSSQRQYMNCIIIDAASARPGDLAFTMEDGVAVHSGIVVGRTESGELLICHASGRATENIVIEPISHSGCSIIGIPRSFYDAY